MVRIYRYFDYRRFLEDWCLFQKREKAHFSYRHFAQLGGLSSAGVVLNIIKGRRNLNSPLVPKFIRALELTEQESRYFELLVRYNQAKSSREKQNWYEELFLLLPEEDKEVIENQKEYFSKWYHAAVREALSILDINHDYKELARFLSPSIKVVEARRSVRLLEDLGLVSRNSEGIFRPSLSHSFSKREAGPEWTLAYQDSLIELGREALWNHNEDFRNISNETFAVSQNGFRKLNLMLDRFYREMHEIFQTDTGEERVYQLNMQLFPLSNKVEATHNDSKDGNYSSQGDRDTLRQMLMERLRKAGE